MRSVGLLAWSLILVGGVAIHHGPGQTWLRLDDSGRQLREADAAADAGQHARAVELYDAALAALPEGRQAESWRIRLERDKSQMLSQQLPEAYNDLDALVLELEADGGADAKLLAEAREAHATAQYYVTWLMRLEGGGKEQWSKPIDRARQTFRLLAEQAAESGDAAGAQRNADNVESAIRLARLDPEELRGLPLPKQCQGCKSGKCKGGNCKGKNPGKKPGEKPKDNRAAGSGPPPDNSGS
jgi:hypothetical protein